MSKKDRVADYMKWSRESFAKHQIVKASEDRWLVRQPGTSAFWFEVVSLAGGMMLVHGDIDAVLFGRYYPSKDATEAQAAIEKIHWMASRTRPDDCYFLEKAKIGTGSGSDGILFTKDEDVFREEIRDLIKQESEGEVDEDGEVDSRKRKRREALEDALHSVGSSTHEEVQRAIYDALEGDAESVPEGRIVSCTMVHVHAALQRLSELLNAVESTKVN